MENPNGAAADDPITDVSPPRTAETFDNAADGDVNVARFADPALETLPPPQYPSFDPVNNEDEIFSQPSPTSSPPLQLPLETVPAPSPSAPSGAGSVPPPQYSPAVQGPSPAAVPPAPLPAASPAPHKANQEDEPVDCGKGNGGSGSGGGAAPDCAGDEPRPAAPAPTAPQAGGPPAPPPPPEACAAPDGSPPTVPAVAAYYDYTVPMDGDEAAKPCGDGMWATSMCYSPCRHPCFFLEACFCPCCCAYLQRQRLLVYDWSRYRCCAGVCGPGLILGRDFMQYPQCWAAMEAVFCLPCAVHGNRYMVMRHYKLQQECCDAAIIYAGLFFWFLGRFCGFKQWRWAADIAIYLSAALMLTQQDYEMKVHPYPAPPAMT